MPKAHGKFSRIITNKSAHPAENRAEANDPALEPVLGYVSYISGSAGKTHCPFVKGIEENNGYFVRVFRKDDTMGYAFSAAVSALDSFAGIKNDAEFAMKENGAYQISAIAAFAAPGAQGKHFHSTMQAVDAYFRLTFMERGMMLGIMGPHHQPGGRKGGTEPLFISQLPLLIVRKMHASDRVFLRNQQEKQAYEKFFGKIGQPDLAQHEQALKHMRQLIDDASYTAYISAGWSGQGGETTFSVSAKHKTALMKAARALSETSPIEFCKLYDILKVIGGAAKGHPAETYRNTYRERVFCFEQLADILSVPGVPSSLSGLKQLVEENTAKQGGHASTADALEKFYCELGQQPAGKAAP